MTGGESAAGGFFRPKSRELDASLIERIIPKYWIEKSPSFFRKTCATWRVITAVNADLA
jgi:hypothetical protein